MKLKDVKNINKFFEIVDKCYGRVDLVCQDMVLNLKSNLAKYFAFTQLCSDDIVDEIEILVYDKEDKDRFVKFMMEGNE